MFWIIATEIYKKWFALNVLEDGQNLRIKIGFHFYKNFNTIFYAVTDVSYRKEYYKECIKLAIFV